MRKINNKSLEKDLKKFIKGIEDPNNTLDKSLRYDKGFAEALDAVAYDLRKILKWKKEE